MVIFVVGIIAVLFFVVRPLRDANKIVMLFTKIRGEQLTFFVGHFQSLYERITKEKENVEKEDFYHIFQDLAMRTRKETETERRTYRPVTSPVSSPLSGWFLRFLLLNSLLMLTLALKYYLSRTAIQGLYNQFFFFKNNAFFDVHTDFAMLTVSAKLITDSRNSTNTTVDYKELFYRALNRSTQLEPATKISALMAVKTDFKTAQKQLVTSDLCDLLPEVAQFCADSFIKNVMSQGMTTLQAVFNFGLQYATDLFVNSAMSGNRSEDIFSNILGVQLYQLNLLSLPFYNKKSDYPGLFF